MKPFVILLCFLLGCELPAAGREPPQNVRICIQYLSLPHAVLTELLSNAPAMDSSLHDQAFALTKVGKAMLLESSMIACRSGEEARVDCVREEIYPTDYEPPQLPNTVPGPPITFKGFMPFTRTFTAFEVREVGLTFTVTPTVKSQDFIHLQLAPDMVHHLRFQTWMEHTDHWGKADFGFPIFETWATRTTLGVKPGTFALVSVITPKRPLPIPFTDARVLLFVRADLVDGEP